MFYKKFSPSPFLVPYVECYYVWESMADLLTPMHVESPPNGLTSVIFNYGDPYKVMNEKYSFRTMPTAFISGQATKSYQLRLNGRIGMIGIVLKPSAIHTLFGIPMYEMSDERIDLTDILGRESSRLYEQLVEAETIPARIALLESFLTVKINASKYPFDRTDFVANMILEKKGILPIKDLMEELFVCQRQFQRHFLRKVGVSPKYFTRISRMSNICAIMAKKQWKVQDWHDLIIQHGYYDQSHFIKEFTDFTGKSPSHYLKGNIELANYLK